MDDVYYNPEKHGLTPVAELELDNESYSFNIICVWKHTDGGLYWGQDSGCSCPSPFEDYHSIEKLQRLSRDNLSEIEGIADTATGTTPLAIKEFMEKVRAAL